MDIPSTSALLLLIFGVLVILTAIHGGHKLCFQEGFQTIQTTGDHPRPMLSRWQPLPAKLLSDLIQRLQRPDHFDPRPQGLAQWNRPILLAHEVCFERIILRDRTHNCLEITYRLPLINFRSQAQITKGLRQLAEVRNFNPETFQINYDSPTSLLISRGQALHHVVAQLVVAKRLLLGELTLQQTQNLLNHLQHSQIYDPDALLKLSVELCSVGIPKINFLGDNSPTEIYTLRPGALPKEVRNMATDVY